MVKKYTLFVSDLHLCPSNLSTLSLFIDWITSDVAKNADAIYILGDLFEAWLGDDDHSAFNQRVKSALKAATRQCPVFIMQGNRDFLIGKEFCQQTNTTLLNDPVKIKLYQQNALLMHGDLLCTDDINYQNARQRFKSDDFQRRVLAKPLWLRKWIAKYYRWRSKRHQQKISDEIMDVNQQAVAEVFQAQQVQLLIHGHTHRPGIHYFRMDQDYYKRITLSDWHHQSHTLIYFEDGKIHLC